MGVLFDGSPSLGAIEDWAKKYLDGPIDARSAVPWDDYEYPEIPAPQDAAIRAFDRDKRFMDWLKEWLDNDNDADNMQAFDVRLPATRESEDVQASTRALLGVTPLDYLDEYLEMCGIRHFSAKELTRHNWHKSKIKKGRSWIRSKASIKPVLEKASSWSSYFSVFDPDSMVHFVLPRRVVPDPRLWPNIIPILRVIDRFRAWKKAPVRGISGYRLPWYNHSIQGSRNSFHMTFSAFDFSYSDRTKNGDIDARIFYRFFIALYRITGSGMGAYASFIHADLDQSRHKLKGKAVRWIHRARRIYSDVFNRGESYSMVGKK